MITAPTSHNIHVSPKLCSIQCDLSTERGYAGEAKGLQNCGAQYTCDFDEEDGEYWAQKRRPNRSDDESMKTALEDGRWITGVPGELNHDPNRMHSFYNSE